MARGARRAANAACRWTRGSSRPCARSRSASSSARPRAPTASTTRRRRGSASTPGTSTISSRISTPRSRSPSASGFPDRPAPRGRVFLTAPCARGTSRIPSSRADPAAPWEPSPDRARWREPSRRPGALPPRGRRGLQAPQPAPRREPRRRRPRRRPVHRDGVPAWASAGKSARTRSGSSAVTRLFSHVLRAASRASSRVLGSPFPGRRKAQTPAMVAGEGRCLQERAPAGRAAATP